MKRSSAGTDTRVSTAGGASQGRRITPIDIQQKEFRLAFRGYNEREVDKFLDEVTEEIARLHADNKRLHEELEARGTVRLDTDAVNQADDILNRAREQAARIVAEAEAESAGRRERSPQPAPEARLVGPDFLGREREFLQSLATLIQSHAALVRDELRRARASTPPVGETGSDTPSAEGDPEPEPDPSPAEPEPEPPPAAAQEWSGQDHGWRWDTGGEDGPPTEAWTPPYAAQHEYGEPGSGEGPSAEGVAGPTATAIATEAPAGGERTIDVRGEAGPIVVPSVESMPETAVAPEGRSEGEGESLRELFWGED